MAPGISMTLMISVAMQSGIRAWLLLLRNCSPAVVESDRVAVELGPPVEEGAVLGDAGGALLGSAGGDDVVLLGGHHGQVQALLDGSAAGCVAVQVVSYGGNHLVGAFRGPGKNALGHGTFTPVDELVLVSSLPSFWLGWVLLPGLVPRRNDWGWYPGPTKPRPVRGFVVLTRWSGAFTAALVRGWVLLLVVYDASQPVEH